MCPLQICNTTRHDTNNAMIERNHEEWAFSMMRVRVARFLKRSVSPVISKAFLLVRRGNAVLLGLPGTMGGALVEESYY